MKKRELRRRVKLLEGVVVELVERVEALEQGDDDGPPKWRDCYGPLVDMDPPAALSDELTFPAPGGWLDDGDDWRRGSYL